MDTSDKKNSTVLRILLLTFSTVLLTFIVIKLGYGYIDSQQPNPINEFEKKTQTNLNVLLWLISISLIIAISFAERPKPTLKQISTNSTLLLAALIIFFIYSGIVIAPWGIRYNVVLSLPFYIIPVQIIFYNLLYKHQGKIWLICTISIYLAVYLVMYYIMKSVDDEFERWKQTIIPTMRWDLDHNNASAVVERFGIKMDFDSSFSLWAFMNDCILFLLHLFLFLNCLFSFIGYRYRKEKTQFTPKP